MGLSQVHILGREGKLFMAAESAFGTFAKHVGGDAFKADMLSFEWDKERIDRDDVRQTRALVERTTGKIVGSWSAEGDVIPSGSAGTPPDIHALLKAAMGSYTNVPATDDTYAGAFAQTALGSVQLTGHHNAYMHTGQGCIVDVLKFSLQGGQKPRWSASGRYKDLITTGYGTLNGALSAGAGSATVATALKENFFANSVVKFGSDTNSGAGYQITSRSGTTLNFTPNAAAGASNGADILPYTPDESVLGSPIPGILGSLSLDGTAVIVTGFEWELNNQHIFIDDEAFQVGLTDAIPHWRILKGTISFRARRDHLIHIGLSRTAFTTRDLAIVCGDTAGQRMKLNVDRAEIKPAKVSIPKDKEGTVTLEWVGLASSATSENEFNVVFD